MRVLKCELKARQLIYKSDSGSKRRSLVIHTNFEKSTDTEVYFSVSSGTIPGKRHIVILSSPFIKEDMDIREIRKIIKNKDIKVACSCEAFLYWGYKYITYKNKAGIDPESRPPNIRNPRQQGMLCKHILSVLRYLGIS